MDKMTRRNFNFKRGHPAPPSLRQEGTDRQRLVRQRSTNKEQETSKKSKTGQPETDNTEVEMDNYETPTNWQRSEKDDDDL